MCSKTFVSIISAVVFHVEHRSIVINCALCCHTVNGLDVGRTVITLDFK
jgi:hypothetical protein